MAECAAAEQQHMAECAATAAAQHQAGKKRTDMVQPMAKATGTGKAKAPPPPKPSTQKPQPPPPPKGETGIVVTLPEAGDDGHAAPAIPKHLLEVERMYNAYLPCPSSLRPLAPVVKAPPLDLWSGPLDNATPATADPATPSEPDPVLPQPPINNACHVFATRAHVCDIENDVHDIDGTVHQLQDQMSQQWEEVGRCGKMQDQLSEQWDKSCRLVDTLKDQCGALRNKVDDIHGKQMKMQWMIDSLQVAVRLLAVGNPNFAQTIGVESARVNKTVREAQSARQILGPGICSGATSSGIPPNYAPVLDDEGKEEEPPSDFSVESGIDRPATPTQILCREGSRPTMAPPPGLLGLAAFATGIG